MHEQNAVDNHGADNQHCCCAEYAPEAQAEASEFDRGRLDFVDDEEQQQWNEVDDLFHEASQRADVPGIITNRAFGGTLSACRFQDIAQALAN